MDQPDMKSLIRIVEGDVVPFSKAPARMIDAHDDNGMVDSMRRLRSFMNDERRTSQLYDVGDALQHRGSGELVDVVSVEDGESDDPILVVDVRSNGKRAKFYASDLEPASVEDW